MFGLLIQILLFFVGLIVPVQRAASLWGEERSGGVWQPGHAFKAIAEDFTTNTRLNELYPQSILHVSTPASRMVCMPRRHDRG